VSYSGTGVVQGYMGTGVVQGYRVSGIAQGYRSSEVVRLYNEYRSSIGVQRLICSTVVHDYKSIGLHGCRFTIGLQGAAVVQEYRSSTGI